MKNVVISIEYQNLLKGTKAKIAILLPRAKRQAAVGNNSRKTRKKFKNHGLQTASVMLK